MTDPITDKPRGFGFVTFEDPSIVEGVCSQEHILDAKKVKCTTPYISVYNISSAID